jgi:hypothetical protein
MAGRRLGAQAGSCLQSIQVCFPESHLEVAWFARSYSQERKENLQGLLMGSLSGPLTVGHYVLLDMNHSFSLI